MTSSVLPGGATALVTGALAGLGLEIARGLAGAGATVLVHGRDAARAKAVADTIEGAYPVAFDLEDRIGMERGLAAANARHGPINILVGNAGIRDRRSFEETSTATLDSVLAVNLSANFELSRLLAPQMIAAGWGRIIFVSSTAATLGPRLGASYAASKGGLEALTRALATQLGRFNILVNAVSPGFFATDFNRTMMEQNDIADMVARRVPLGRWARPDEIVGPVLFLASPASTYVSGVTLHVDGGLAHAG